MLCFLPVEDSIMSTIAATNSSANNAIASLLRSGSTAGTETPRNSETSGKSSSSGNPVDTVDLSDHAHAVLARAKVDKVAADRLAAQVEAGRGRDKSGQSSTASDASKPSQTTRYTQWAATLTAPVTVQDAPAPYGDPTTSDAQILKDISGSLLGIADTYDKEGLPPEVGQAIRAAVTNGTVKIQQASDVPDLNMHSINTYTPSPIGGPSEWGSTSQNPTGATKQALDQGRAFAMWSADRGNIYISW
jgi:hypothetical protein